MKTPVSSFWFPRCVLALLCAAASLPVEAANTNNITIFSNSSITTQSVISTGTGAASYLTELRTLGQQPPGFDLSFGKAFNDASVQAAITAARKILLGAGVPASIANQGPVRAASSLTSYGPAGAVTGSQTTQKVTVSTYIGPQTIHVGVDQATPFTLAGGQVDIDVLTDTHTDIFQSRGGSLLSETYVIPIDVGAVLSLAYSGMPVAQTQRASLLAAQNAIGDVNSRIFRAMLGPNDSGAPQGDGSVSDDVRGFATGSFGWLSQSQSTGGTTPGLRDRHESASVGAEKKLGKAWRLGFSATYVHSDTDISGGLGTRSIDGGALSVYATWRGDPWYADLLYSAARFHDITKRNMPLGTASGSADEWGHTVSLNAGYVFKVTDTFATGPYVSLTYVHGDLDAYSEHGGGSAALGYGAQNFDSLVSTVGWQASWKLRRPWGSITPQVRVGWERENFNDAGVISAALLQSPFYTVTGGSFGGFGLSANRESGRYDALAVGIAVDVEIGERWSLVLGAAESTNFGTRNDLSLALQATFRF
jgi:uncharacterized protein YhjY with autotransporter beta-barrel domain